MIGLLELGLKNDALTIAQRILSSGSSDKQEFVAAVTVILETDGCKAKAHENLVTAAYARLSKTSQRYVRCMVFRFYFAIGELETAAGYISLDFVESSHLLVCMMALLKLKRFNQARRIFKIAQQQLKKASGNYERSNWLAVMAKYYSHTGKHAEAERYWMMVAKYNEPTALSALVNLVWIQTARGLHFVEFGLETIEKFTKQDREKMPLPDSNSEAALRFTKQKLETYRDLLRKVGPKERQKELEVDQRG